MEKSGLKFRLKSILLLILSLLAVAEVNAAAGTKVDTKSVSTNYGAPVGSAKANALTMRGRLQWLPKSKRS